MCSCPYGTGYHFDVTRPNGKRADGPCSLHLDYNACGSTEGCEWASFLTFSRKFELTDLMTTAAVASGRLLSAVATATAGAGVDSGLSTLSDPSEKTIASTVTDLKNKYGVCVGNPHNTVDVGRSAFMDSLCVMFSFLPILVVAFVFCKFLFFKRGTRELSLLGFIAFMVIVNEGVLKNLKQEQRPEASC